MNNPSKKIFVGGVALNVDDAPFRSYFEVFGRVVEAQIIRDRTTGRSRGFGFVTFHEESAVDAVVNNKHIIMGKVHPLTFLWQPLPYPSLCRRSK